MQMNAFAGRRFMKISGATSQGACFKILHNERERQVKASIKGFMNTAV